MLKTNKRRHETTRESAKVNGIVFTTAKPTIGKENHEHENIDEPGHQ
jgi:hypothetical protein